MTDKPKTYTTKTGKVLTDADIKQLADEAERGYDVEALKSRRRGRPMLGSAPSEVAPAFSVIVGQKTSLHHAGYGHIADGIGTGGERFTEPLAPPDHGHHLAQYRGCCATRWVEAPSRCLASGRHASADGQAAHLLAVADQQASAVLAQAEVDGKTNEITCFARCWNR